MASPPDIGRLGLEAKAYRDTANDYTTPTWSEVTNIRDLTQNLEKGEADMSTRGSGGFRAVRGTLKNGTVEFQMLFAPSDPEFTAIQNAYFNNEILHMAFMSGDITTAGEQGLRGWFDVLNFSRSEALEEGQLVDVTMALAPALAAEPPYWYTVP